ncbi:Alpha-catulin, partial [Fragariocoptes setiger]
FWRQKYYSHPPIKRSVDPLRTYGRRRATNTSFSRSVSSPFAERVRLETMHSSNFPWLAGTWLLASSSDSSLSSLSTTSVASSVSSPVARHYRKSNESPHHHKASEAHSLEISAGANRLGGASTHAPNINDNLSSTNSTNENVQPANTAQTTRTSTDYESGEHESRQQQRFRYQQQQHHQHEYDADIERIVHIQAIGALLERTHDFTDCAYTSHEHRQNILMLVDCIKAQINHIVKTMLHMKRSGSSMNMTDTLRVLARQIIDLCDELKFELQMVAIEQCDELDRISTQSNTLRKLKHCCLNGDRERLAMNSYDFTEHAEHMVEVCRLMNQVAPTHKLKISTRSLIHWIELNTKQVINACYCLCLNSGSKIAKDNLWSFIQVWSNYYDDLCQVARQLAYLAHSHDRAALARASSSTADIKARYLEDLRHQMNVQKGQQQQNSADHNASVRQYTTQRWPSMMSLDETATSAAAASGCNQSSAALTSSRISASAYTTTNAPWSPPHPLGPILPRASGISGSAGPPYPCSSLPYAINSYERAPGLHRNTAQTLAQPCSASSPVARQLASKIIYDDRYGRPSPPLSEPTSFGSACQSTTTTNPQQRTGYGHNKGATQHGAVHSAGKYCDADFVPAEPNDFDQVLSVNQQSPLPRRAPHKSNLKHTSAVRHMPPTEKSYGQYSCASPHFNISGGTTQAECILPDTIGNLNNSHDADVSLVPTSAAASSKAPPNYVHASPGSLSSCVPLVRQQRQARFSNVKTNELASDNGVDGSHVALTQQPPVVVPGTPPSVGGESSATTATDADKWSDSEDNDIVQTARTTAQMAFSMYQFTRGEGELNTTQDLFTQAELFAEEANELYKDVRRFSYEVPAGNLKKQLLAQLDLIPNLVQQLQFTVKNPTVGKPATFTKVDNVIRETRSLMEAVNRVVSASIACRQHYKMGTQSMRKRSRTLSPSYRSDECFEFETQSSARNINARSAGGGTGSEPDI